MINKVINGWWVVRALPGEYYECQCICGLVKKIHGGVLHTDTVPKCKCKYQGKRYTYLGSEYTIAELSEICGLSKSSLRHRIETLKWSVVDAMTKPKLAKVDNLKRHDNITEVVYQGSRYKLSELALIHDIPYHTLRYRVNAGWPIELAIDRNATYRGKGGTREYTLYELRKKYTIEGTEYSLEELAYKFKIGAKTFLNRLKAGLSPDEAVAHRPYEYIEYTYLGESNSLGYFAKKYGINKATLHTRLKAGWSLEEALSRSPLPPKARRFGRSYDLRDRNQQ